MMLVGLTGGIACGKTTVCEIFRKNGARVLSSDAIIHQHMQPGGSAYKRIVKRYGDCILRHKRIQRKALRAIVLERPKEMRFLEKLLHPTVRRTIRSHAKVLKKRRGVFVVEVPLLFETGFDRLFDKTIAVIANKRRNLKYAAKRNIKQADLRGFQSKQWTIARKAKKANIVIQNNHSLAMLKARVKAIHKQLQQNDQV